MDSTPEQASAPTEDNNVETEDTTSNIDNTKQDVEDNKPGLDKEDDAPLYATVDKTSKEDQTGYMVDGTNETAKQEEITESVGDQEKETKEVAQADSPVAARADSHRAGGDQAYTDDANPYEEIEVQPATQEESTGVTETQETKENVCEERPPTPPASETPSEEPPSYNDVQDDDQQEPEETPESEPEPEPVPVPVVADTPSHDYHPRQCHIRKWPDFQGYGFNLHAEKEKKGQYIGLVDANSPADDAGLQKGDRIIEVNGENIEDTTHQQVIQKIKAGGEETILLVVDQDTDDFYKNNGIKITADLPEVIKGETTPRDSSSVPESSPYNPRLCHIIKWADFNGYGFNLHAEKERGGQYIGKIDAASPAEDGGLRENDRIIEVNGANVENETHQQVISRIKQGGDETKLLVVDRDADKYYKSKGVTVTSSMSEVKRMATARRSPKTSSAVTNGDSRPAPQQTRVMFKKHAPSPPRSPEVTEQEIFTLSASDIKQRIQRKKSDKRLQRHSMREKVNMFDQL
ncbi:Na(+)/H(+) exchange regulatory cofactor NHE-RF1-like isoform X2 [Mya arenaria]|uniref:Na(+)/H(+) exchange regulatory cofactor NHE-RF1-like isoform X2 n=1 Tax=Mya arenaria TaxID=6604 RepID=UPI0022DF4373|nr:Na(+)/H(+) exchange regulatory cofactor NHE-RF1-like isoform X2 [Mya arenaria]